MAAVAMPPITGTASAWARLVFAPRLEHRRRAEPRFVERDRLDHDVRHLAPVARREDAQAVFELLRHAQIELRHFFGFALAAGPPPGKRVRECL